jgi:DNA-binding IclR family transcriptional regulator
MYAPVVDAGGHVVGALSIQAISHAIGHASAEVPSAPERAA